MSVYVIAQGKIENRGLIDQYVAKVIPTIESHQGRIVAFDEEPEVVEGSIEHSRTVILEFPSMTAFHAWYDSPERVCDDTLPRLISFSLDGCMASRFQVSLPQFTREATLTGFEPVLPP